MALQAEVGHTLQNLAAAETPAAHKAAIHATTPSGAKARAAVALALHKEGHGPDTALGKAQLALLAHPDASHADFKKAAEDQHGEGLGSFLAGLAKGIFAPIKAIGGAIFGHHVVKKSAKLIAGELVKAATAKAGAAIAAHVAG